MKRLHPDRLDPEHAGVLRIVALHCLHFAAHVGKAGTARVGGGRLSEHRADRGERNRGDDKRARAAHVTVICTRSVCAKPLSPSQTNSSVPLAVAIVVNAR